MGTSGDIKIGKEDGEEDPTGTGGVYNVDSSGKLTGSFVASANTRNGGQIYVQDLGTWDVRAGLEPRRHSSQSASATPGDDGSAARGPRSASR